MTTYCPPAHPLVADPGHPRLKDYVIEHTGLTYYSNRDDDLAHRVSRRLLTLGLKDCTTYLRLLQDAQAGLAEFDSLVTELTIGETYFFRHREMFDALRQKVLPELIERKKQVRRLRIWSAGCATGPEAYSLAIMLKRELGHLVEGWEISILGTDINREFLARAIEGRYDEWAFRSCPDEIRKSCFQPSGGSWVLKPLYQNCVSFQYHNLVRHPIPSLLHNIAGFDLILCRNVMIYFSIPAIRKLLGQFEQCLVEGGWLMVGHAEPNLELFRSFRSVNAPGATLYQKAPAMSGREIIPPSQAAARFDTCSHTGPTLPPKRKAVECPAPLPGVANLACPAPSPADPLEDVRLLADQGHCEEALRRMALLLDSEKLNPAAHFVHALVLEQMGRHIESERSLRQAVYLDRNFVLAHYYLGLCLQRSRNKLGACRTFRNVLTLLDQRDQTEIFPHGDGITTGNLREVTEMNLEVLQRE